MEPREVLGVSPGATRAEIIEAFRRFALRHHPDRGGDVDRFQAGLDAYRQLTGSKSPPRHGAGASRGTADNVVFHRRARPGLTSILRVARRRLTATRSRS